MTLVSLAFIRGMSLGLEFPEYEDSPFLVIDLFILRIIIDRVTLEESEEE